MLPKGVAARIPVENDKCNFAYALCSQSVQSGFDKSCAYIVMPDFCCHASVMYIATPPVVTAENYADYP
jgi:hypothetical protein